MPRLEYSERFANDLSAVTSERVKKLVMEPVFPEGLDAVDASYQSVYGEIKSAWTKKDGAFQWNITLPGNTTAIVRIPKDYHVVVGNMPGVQQVNETESYVEVEIGSGNYVFKSA